MRVYTIKDIENFEKDAGRKPYSPTLFGKVVRNADKKLMCNRSGSNPDRLLN